MSLFLEKKKKKKKPCEMGVGASCSLSSAFWLADLSKFDEMGVRYFSATRSWCVSFFFFFFFFLSRKKKKQISQKSFSYVLFFFKFSGERLSMENKQNILAEQICSGVYFLFFAVHVVGLSFSLLMYINMLLLLSRVCQHLHIAV